jgi:cytochrome P450
MRYQYAKEKEGSDVLHKSIDNPITAVSHQNPYPYYSNLIIDKPIYFDELLSMWIVSSADSVDAVLTSVICKVRPLREQVPKTLTGSRAGDIFGRMIRMNDGEYQAQMKNAVIATMDAVDAEHFLTLCKKWSQHLIHSIHSRDTAWIQKLAFQLPVYVMASLLGVPTSQLRDIERSVNDFVRGIAPNSSAEQIVNGKLAAETLFTQITDIIAAGASNNLLAGLSAQATSSGHGDTSVVAANAIGFLSQSYEATAGLLLNTIYVLGSRPDVYEQVKRDSNLLAPAIEEVLRYDPPIQNTRRYVSEDCVIAGQRMRKGDTILLVLAAANRDGSANPAPEEFDLFRKHRHIFTFGRGPHVCPGNSLATIMAKAGVEELMLSGIDFRRFHPNVSYMPSPNARIPLLQFV